MTMIITGDREWEKLTLLLADGKKEKKNGGGAGQSWPGRTEEEWIRFSNPIRLPPPSANGKEGDTRN